MKYKVLSILLALSVLTCLSACEKDDVNKMAEVTQKEDAVLALPEAEPSGRAADSGTGPSSPSGQTGDGDTESLSLSSQTTDGGMEPPPPSEPDYRSLSAEILAAVWDGNIPGTAEVSEEMDSISNHLEMELSYPIEDSGVAITFDKETGLLRRVSETQFTGLLKPARYDSSESAARAWYAALPLPQDYPLHSVTGYGDDLLCYEFNKAVTLETGGAPVELFSSYEAVRIMVHTDTGALHSAIAFDWPVFDGHPQKTAISEAEAVELAGGSKSGSETVSSQITLYHAHDPIAVSDCPPERSLDYSFPAWAVEFRGTSDVLEDCGSVVYVDLYTGEILGRDMW